MFYSLNSGSSNVWIGVRRESNNAWKFVDGTNINYVAPGQNLGNDNPDEGCARMAKFGTHGDVHLNDQVCHNRYNYICSQ